jgi:hypothetical protein
VPTKINFTPDNSSPIFLSEIADEAEQPDIGIAPELALDWSRVLKTISILIAAAAAVGFAYLYSENTGAFFATTKASLFDKLALKSGTDQPTPTIQTIASTQDQPATATDEPAVNPGPVPVLDDKTALGDTTERRPAVLPSATDAPARNEVAVAASQPADQNVTNGGQPSTDALFKQYQAWLAERAQKHPAQDAKARGVQNAGPQGRQQAQLNQNARAQIRPVQHSRTNVRREQNAQVQNPTVQGASAQAPSVQGRPAKDPSVQNAPAEADPSAQNSQVPSLFQIFKRN